MSQNQLTSSKEIKLDKFSACIIQQFNEQFKLELSTPEQVVEYYKSQQNIQLPWKQIGASLGITTKQAYKYFRNTYCKHHLQPWPDTIKKQVIQSIDQYLAENMKPDVDEEIFRSDLMQYLNGIYHFQEQEQYHYETMYFFIRAKLKTELSAARILAHQKNKKVQENMQAEKLSALFSQITQNQDKKQ
ncbi:Conserved_hypothetical protein [Hexamita inflata]|uniref:Uncharacterized protein n=1 Tax=Hexamita inflata TaxID=28002 RepID=A0AA86VPC8_9EUKA|nr:Conserved hypothetical protein [Hexamita inflata]CAI9972253.1 Conserved hypothetical protein [Hexamita inflata]